MVEKNICNITENMGKHTHWLDLNIISLLWKLGNLKKYSKKIWLHNLLDWGLGTWVGARTFLVNSFAIGQEAAQKLTCLVPFDFGAMNSFPLACDREHGLSLSVLAMGWPHFPIMVSGLSCTAFCDEPVEKGHLQQVSLVSKWTYATLENTAYCAWSTSYIGRFHSGAIRLELVFLVGKRLQGNPLLVFD